MMQHLTNDPSFWVGFWALVGMVFTAAATLLGLLIAWAKAKTAEIEARDAKAGLVVTAKSLDRVEQAAGTVAAQVSTHSAQIAALQTQQAQGTAGAPPAAERLDPVQAAQTAAHLLALTAQQTAAQIAAEASGAASAGDSRSAALAPQGAAPLTPEQDAASQSAPSV